MQAHLFLLLSSWAHCQEVSSGFITSLMLPISKLVQANTSKKTRAQLICTIASYILSTAMKKKLLSHDQSPTKAHDTFLLQPWWIRNYRIWAWEHGFCNSQCCSSRVCTQGPATSVRSIALSASTIQHIMQTCCKGMSLKKVNQVSGLWLQLSRRVVTC